MSHAGWRALNPITRVHMLHSCQTACRWSGAARRAEERVLSARRGGVCRQRQSGRMAFGLNALHMPCRPALSPRIAMVTHGAARGWEEPVGRHRQHRLGSGLQPHRPHEPLVRLGVSGIAVPEPHTEFPELRPEHNSQDIEYMHRAYAQAWMGYERLEIPIGAVVVHDGRVVGEAHNNALETNDPTSHAEMRAIKQAATAIGNWRHLRDATLYVTVEPCVMCAGAILQSRVGRLVYGAPNYLLGGDGSWVQLFNIPRKTHGDEMDALDGDVPSALTAHPYQPQVEIVRGVMETECKDLMQRFFRERRQLKFRS